MPGNLSFSLDHSAVRLGFQPRNVRISVSRGRIHSLTTPSALPDWQRPPTMPRLSELADILVKCQVISKSQWEEAARIGREDLSGILAHLAKSTPYWWEGSPPSPPGLTEYQRDIIRSRFNENELQFLRRDLTLNQFLLLDKLGQGGQGEVYRSRQLNPPRFAAVKILTRDTESRRKRFEQEARAMIKIQHPGVARFYLYERIRNADGDPTDEYLIAMEFVNGTDLQQLVRKIGPISWPFAVHWVCDLLSGLVFIHESGFIHRDVKPENVMIVGPHPGPRVSREETAAKLLDFGAVNKVSETVKLDGSAPRVFVGTMEYASPEQWNGEIVVASDIYALGGTLFYMLTGRHAFKKERRNPSTFMNAHLREPVPNLFAFNLAVPPELNRLFQQMMAKDPNERGTATQLLEEFQQLRPRNAAIASAPQPTSATSNRGRPKSTSVEPARSTDIVQPNRPIFAASEMRIQNPFSRIADRLLSFLERIFIPGHLRIAHETDAAILERLFALLRRPLVLAILAIILAILVLSR
jgi:eukaryotic-like serine/threonine-protein kinase